MSIKKLSFKGDASFKKRKRPTTDTTTKSPTKARNQDANGEEEEGWVNAECLQDLSGPIVITCCYDTPLSLIADARGTLFTIPLEPVPASLAEAEPHDVRQVFIAAALVGGGQDSVSLKNGATGKYLSTNRLGGVKCDKDAIGPTEEWTLVIRPDGWALRSVYETYLSISKTSKVRSDVEDVGFCETLTIRIQKRNKFKAGKEGSAAAAKASAIGRPFSMLTKKDLEARCGRPLSIEEADTLRDAQGKGCLSEAILDMRVKGRADKFG